MKFFKRKQPIPITDEMKKELAERKLTDKINALADFFDKQEKWTMFETYCVMAFLMKQSIGPQMDKKQKELADKAVEAMFIKEEVNKIEIPKE